MIEHWMTDSRLKVTCYCGAKVEGKTWKSVFHGERHYKITGCSCGKELWLNVSFTGSGHDSWDGTHSWISSTAKPKPRREKLRSIDDKV